MAIATKAPQRRLLEPELEQRFTEPRERILMLGLEDECFLEAPAGPGILLTSQARIPNADVQLHRIRVECQAFAEDRQRVVVLPFVVELMRLLVILFGAQERSGHCDESLLLVRDILLYHSVTGKFNSLCAEIFGFFEFGRGL